ncbi:MAG TPA: glycosyltransferase family 9 protein [Vicinamibacterales bacterium]|nr:glycosyltransferase family 9 protein [Vicinamibacterales bacterium]
MFTTPALSALRRRFPDARITYLVEAAAEPVVRHHPALDEVVVLERPRGLARIRYDLALASRLRRERFDLVIDLHGGPRSGFLTLATGAPQRIGYDLPGRRWSYTTRVPWTRSLVPPRHSVLNQFALLEPLGVPPLDRAQDPVTIPVDPDAASRVSARLAGAGVSDTAPLIVLHVSAGNPFRRWPAESFAAAAAALATADRSRRIIITSGPSESAAAESVANEARRRAGDAAGGIIRTAEFDLAELRALVDRAALYIGGDSGPLHVAGATRTPIVALFGPTLPERSMPWRDPGIGAIAVDAGPLPCRPCHQRHCVPGDFRCLTMISPNMVVDAAERLLAK